MAVITIARQIGSGGDLVASRVAEELGYDLVDSALLARVAEHAEVSVEEVMNLDERYRSQAAEWLMNFITPRIGKIILENDRQFNPERYLEYVREVVAGLAGKGNVVIVGRGGQFILRDRENALHVRIVADMDSRVEWMRRYEDVSNGEAIERIKRSDAMRSGFVSRYFKGDWNDPLLYHLVLNTGKFSHDEAVAIIVEAARKFSLGREYIPGVRDRRSGIDRRVEERRKGDRRSFGSIWTVRDVERALLREGRSIRLLSRTDRRQEDRRKTIRREEDRLKLQQNGKKETK